MMTSMVTKTEKSLPETCTLLLSLDLTVHETFNPHTLIATDITENTSLQSILGPTETSTIETDVVLGKGGMGIVLCGQQTVPNREVAIKKVLKASGTYKRMLLQEAQITGQLEHPNIVPIHQIIQNENDELLVIMKKVEGKTLLELLPTFQPSDTFELPTTALQYLIQICHALEYAHSHEIVHRDIKLENIMIGDFNEVLLMDWGLGMHLLNQIGANPGVVGTPCYLAPEMLSGKPEDIDVRTDIYLMGATLHHLLIGEARHNGTKVRETLEQAQRSEPIDYPNHIPSIFAQIMNKACARSKSKRYQSMMELREAIETALEHWEAIKLSEQAKRNFEQFTVDIAEFKLDVAQVSRHFLRIRTQLESAIDIWSDNQLAKDTLNSLLMFMVDYYIERLEISLAMSLFSDVSNPPDDLTSRIKQAEREYKRLTEAHERAQEYDPLQSKSGRKTLIVSLAAVSVLLVSFAGGYSYFVSQEVTTLRLVYTGSLVSATCILGVFLGRKTLLTNKLGAQMARIFTVSSLLATLNHWVGHMNSESATGIMTVDMFIMAAAYALMRDSVRSAYLIAFIDVCFGITSIFYPQTAHPLLLATILFSTMWALLDWYKEE